MRLDSYLAKLSEAKRKGVQDRLSTLETASAIGRQAVINLRAETRLPSAALKDLMAGLLKSANDAGEIKQAMTAVMRCHVLEDRELPPPLPSSLGRAVTLDQFARLLKDQGYRSTVLLARRAIRSLLGRSGRVVRNRWRTYSLGKYLMWCTFDQSLSAADPFATMPSEADEVRALLGLSVEDRGKELLLLVYELPADAKLRYPSVAEAYAGSGWNYFFRPAAEGAPFGLTMLWPEREKEAPRPEAVHEVITGGNLTAPLRSLT